MMRVKHFLLLLIILISLTGCFCEQCPSRKNTTPCGELIDSLQAQGVQVIQLGDTLRIILPVDTFFEPPSAYDKPWGTRVKSCKAGTLKQVAELVVCHCYVLSNIRVYGYSDQIGPIKDQKQRSLQQARNIAAYLWANGIPLERMQVRGFGARGSVAGNGTPNGEYANRRVEILLP